MIFLKFLFQIFNRILSENIMISLNVLMNVFALISLIVIFFNIFKNKKQKLSLTLKSIPKLEFILLFFFLFIFSLISWNFRVWNVTYFDEQNYVIASATLHKKFFAGLCFEGNFSDCSYFGLMPHGWLLSFLASPFYLSNAVEFRRSFDTFMHFYNYVLTLILFFVFFIFLSNLEKRLFEQYQKIVSHSKKRLKNYYYLIKILKWITLVSLILNPIMLLRSFSITLEIPVAIFMIVLLYFLFEITQSRKLYLQDVLMIIANIILIFIGRLELFFALTLLILIHFYLLKPKLMFSKSFKKWFVAFYVFLLIVGILFSGYMSMRKENLDQIVGLNSFYVKYWFTFPNIIYTVIIFYFFYQKISKTKRFQRKRDSWFLFYFFLILLFVVIISLYVLQKFDNIYRFMIPLLPIYFSLFFISSVHLVDVNLNKIKKRNLHFIVGIFIILVCFTIIFNFKLFFKMKSNVEGWNQANFKFYEFILNFDKIINTSCVITSGTFDYRTFDYLFIYYNNVETYHDVDKLLNLRKPIYFFQYLNFRNEDLLKRLKTYFDFVPVNLSDDFKQYIKLYRLIRKNPSHVQSS